MEPPRLQSSIRFLYEGNSGAARRFRIMLVTFDLVIIGYLIVSSFVVPLASAAADIVIGGLLVADFLARLWAAPSRRKLLASPEGLADIAVIFAVFAPLFLTEYSFIRDARIFRLFRSYQLLIRLKRDFPWVNRNGQTLTSALNLAVFLFVTTALVYETQHHANPGIATYNDAFYFTVTTLTTTGYGDVTLQGPWGRLLASLIMIVGVSLFLRLVQVALRPSKVEYQCPTCGLMRHDYDAVHCKACGTTLNIADEGLV